MKLAPRIVTTALAALTAAFVLGAVPTTRAAPVPVALSDLDWRGHSGSATLLATVKLKSHAPSQPTLLSMHPSRRSGQNEPQELFDQRQIELEDAERDQAVIPVSSSTTDHEEQVDEVVERGGGLDLLSEVAAKVSFDDAFRAADLPAPLPREQLTESWAPSTQERLANADMRTAVMSELQPSAPKPKRGRPKKELPPNPDLTDLLAHRRREMIAASFKRSKIRQLGSRAVEEGLVDKAVLEDAERIRKSGPIAGKPSTGYIMRHGTLTKQAKRGPKIQPVDDAELALKRKTWREEKRDQSLRRKTGTQLPRGRPMIMDPDADLATTFKRKQKASYMRRYRDAKKAKIGADAPSISSPPNALDEEPLVHGSSIPATSSSSSVPAAGQSGKPATSSTANLAGDLRYLLPYPNA